MKIDTNIVVSNLRDVPAMAQAAEAMGFDGSCRVRWMIGGDGPLSHSRSQAAEGMRSDSEGNFGISTLSKDAIVPPRIPSAPWLRLRLDYVSLRFYNAPVLHLTVNLSLEAKY